MLITPSTPRLRRNPRPRNIQPRSARSPNFNSTRDIPVSRTLLKPDEIVGPIVSREPFYRVDVALERQSIRAYGAELPLGPDLELQADILFERRTVLAWILDPLFSA